MDRLRFLAVSTASKVATKIISASGRGKAQAAPGLIALKLDPELIARAHKYFDKSVFVTGTNGKTTTTKLITMALRKSGQRVISNETGSNLERGLAASIATHLSGFGNLGQAYAVWEADESAFTKILPDVDVDVVVLLNLFRDQLDRYGEIDSTAKKIFESIKKKEKLQLVVNGDDPYMVAIARQFEGVVYFGVRVKNKRVPDQKSVKDAISCPYCYGELVFDSPIYSHLGQFACKKCDFGSPKIDYAVVDYDQREVKIQRGRNVISLPRISGGFYNVYNEVAAFAAAELLGVKVNDFAATAGEFKVPFGRYERVSFENKEITTVLVKNPTGMSQALKATVEEGKKNSLILALNSGIADGRDTSWIWDVDFEGFVKNTKTFSYVVTGDRRYDMAVRLKYAGILPQRITVVRSYKDAFRLALKSASDAIYYLPTYTALMESYKFFDKEDVR